MVVVGERWFGRWRMEEGKMGGAHSFDPPPLDIRFTGNARYKYYW
jgi:hypothetical protein